VIHPLPRRLHRRRGLPTGHPPSRPTGGKEKGAQGSQGSDVKWGSTQQGRYKKRLPQGTREEKRHTTKSQRRSPATQVKQHQATKKGLLAVARCGPQWSTKQGGRGIPEKPERLLAMWQTRPQNLRLLLLPDGTGNSLATGTMEGRGCRNDETEKRRRTRGTPSGKTAEGGSSRGNGHGPTALGRLGRLRFLRNSALLRVRVKHLVCGTSKRKRKEPGPEDSAPGKKRKKNDRPIISMMLHWNGSQHPVKALLDTGCSVTLINQQTIE